MRDVLSVGDDVPLYSGRQLLTNAMSSVVGAIRNSARAQESPGPSSRVSLKKGSVFYVRPLSQSRHTMS